MKGWQLALLAGGLVLMAGGGISAAGAQKRARVLNRVAACGVHPHIQYLLDQWELNGPFDVEIGQIPGYPGGGLRTAADAAGQAAAAQAGLSQAGDISSTPHGRGAAVDLWPVGFGFDWRMTYEQWTPEIKSAFQAIGDFAKSYGFVWGGDWSNATFPHGDQPHVEMADWLTLPYPPPNYSC